MIQLLPHKDLYAIKVPLEAYDFHVDNQNGPSLYFKANHGRMEGIGRCRFIESGNWQILGEVTKDNISFNVESYIEKSTVYFPEHTIVYRNYLESLLDPHRITNEFRQKWGTYCNTDNESFYSLLATNGMYFENPLQKQKETYLFKGSENSWSNKELEQWQHYEDNLVEKVLIIQKI